MKTPLLICVIVCILFSFTVSAEDLSGIPGWNYSVENSYPQSGTIDTPKLGKQLGEVIKLNAGDPFSTDCRKAIQRFGYVYSQFADNFELYAHVPTCNLGERALILIGKLLDEGGNRFSEEIYRFKEENFDPLHVFFQRGSYYFEKELAGQPSINLLKAAYDFKMAYFGFTYAVKMVTTFKNMIQEGRQQGLKAEYEKRINEYQNQIAGEGTIELVRKILAQDPEDKRFKGILGSLLIRGRGVSGFGEAKTLLESLCNVNIYKQACDDLARVK